MNGRALLDISVLLPLFDPLHVHHEMAHAWWGDGQTWASCPLTQNGFVRILSRPSYPASLSTAEAVTGLSALSRLDGHEFWPDDISITDPQVFDHSRILGPNQITDIYLLVLAVKHGGRLVTFDRGVTLAAVRGAHPHHLLIL